MGTLTSPRVVQCIVHELSIPRVDQSTNCPVRELTGPRFNCPRVVHLASWPVRDLVFRELTSPRFGCPRFGLSASWPVTIITLKKLQNLFFHDFVAINVPDSCCYLSILVLTLFDRAVLLIFLTAYLYGRPTFFFIKRTLSALLWFNQTVITFGCAIEITWLILTRVIGHAS